MPVEEEGRLHDPRLRENFVDRVFMYRRLRGLLSGRWTVGRLVAFHTAHKLVLMAHSPEGYRELGRLVADAKRVPRAELARRYEDELMAAMSKPATRARHANTLQHAAGHFKRTLDSSARHELGAVIGDRGLPTGPRSADRPSNPRTTSRAASEGGLLDGTAVSRP